MDEDAERRRHHSESLADDVNIVTVVTKQPLKRLDVALRRITVTAIPLHLEFLAKHKENISRFQEEGQWDKVHAEQVHASRTVQQLKYDIRELETLRQHVFDEEMAQFEAKIKDVRDQASKAVQEFIELHSEVTEPLVPQVCSTELPSLRRSPTPPVLDLPQSWGNIDKPQVTDLTVATTTNMIAQEESSLLAQATVAKVTVESMAARSWFLLRKELVELHSLMQNFAAIVMGQREKVDKIDDHVDTACENVKEGRKNLARALALKTAFLPLTGAMVGGVIGGPIGLMAGFKLAGALGAVGGAIVGFGSTKLIQNHQRRSLEVEMQEIPRLRSASCSDLCNLTSSSGAVQ